jgi:energy-coupling factor transporter ATP-binding protein EcfA2
MHTESLQLKNIGPFDSFGVKPKALTIIRGRNGAGKTTIVNAIRYLAEKNHDPSLIKIGAEFGEIRLVIADPGHEYDGANFVCTVTPEKTTRVLHHPKLGKIPVAKSKEWIEGCINMISLDPVRFLTAGDKEQVAIFLQAQPLRVTTDQLGFVPTAALKDVDLDKHALEVLGDNNGGIYGALYEQRTGINSEAKTKAAYAMQLQATLPEDAPDGNWAETLQRANAEFRELQNATKGRLNAITSDAQKAAEAQRELFRAKEKAVNEEMAVAIERIRADSAIEIKRCEADRDHKLAAINNGREGALTAAKSEYEPKHQDLTNQIAKAKAMADQHIKAQATRDLIAQAQADATEAEVRSANITQALKKIEALKADMLKETPIPGLEISNGFLVLDGVPMKRVNDAKKSLKVALQIGKLQAGPLGFMVMDNCEKFDEEQLPMVEQAASELGMQVLMTIATVRDRDGNPIEGLDVETKVANAR